MDRNNASVQEACRISKMIANLFTLALILAVIEIAGDFLTDLLRMGQLIKGGMKW